MRLSAIVAGSAAIAATNARREKIALLSDLLQQLTPEEAAIGVAYLSSGLRQRQIGVGHATLRNLPGPADAPTLTLVDVDSALDAIGEVSGRDAVAERRRLLAALFTRATTEEQDYLVRLIIGELRQGALEGIMQDAVARALHATLAKVRRAVMLRGDLGAVFETAVRDGLEGLSAFGLQPGRPILPMLAQSAPTVSAALDRLAPAALEWKLDGARLQVHVVDGEVRCFTRSLDDITSRIPEVVELVRVLPVRTAVFDAEVLALRPDGRPHPFQVSASRFGSRLDVDRLRATLPLSPFFFDILHLDGKDLLDLPASERHAALARVVPAEWRAPRIEAADVFQAEEFVARTLAAGHEGVMVKALSAPYEAGRRGASWIKVKPVHTLDLVILAAEWGHGRRRGWLSNLHLGARDGDNYVMLGKTFKGVTDAMLRWQTEKLLELERDRDRWTVYVRPELVVEIAFDGIQSSSRYPGGVTLRFARVVRYRDDKPVTESDTLDAVRQLSSAQ
ncbi:MAG: ATP-dependent DNA ligase [Chloroflexota bacterium]